MYKWTFEIKSPTGNYMRELSAIPDSDIWIAEEADDLSHWFSFSSVHLNQLNDPDKVYEHAMKLKMLVDGISFLIHENKNAYRPIELGNLYDEHNKVTQFNQNIENHKFDFSFKTTDVNEYYKSNPVSHLLHLAGDQTFVLNVLIMCSRGMDFTSLYQILDEVKNFLKGKINLDTLDIDQKELKRFTHTANNFEALGIDSRHGNLGHEAPKDPMALQDAQRLITHLLSIVVKNFYGIILPVVKDIKVDADDLF